MIVGADTPIGRRLVEAFADPEREVRAFVSDPEQALELKAMGVKVATGDLSDTSHLAAACTRVFTAILVADAARDGREYAFATGFEAIVGGWAKAVAEPPVSRVIWFGFDDPPATDVAEVTIVSPSLSPDRQIERAVSLDDADQILGDP